MGWNRSEDEFTSMLMQSSNHRDYHYRGHRRTILSHSYDDLHKAVAIIIPSLFERLTCFFLTDPFRSARRLSEHQNSLTGRWPTTRTVRLTDKKLSELLTWLWVWFAHVVSYVNVQHFLCWVFYDFDGVRRCWTALVPFYR